MFTLKKAAATLATIVALCCGLPAIASAQQMPEAAALGDSYMSGEGGTETGPYLPGSDTSTDQCHRSASGVAVLTAAIDKLNLAVNAACSGATTRNITTDWRYDELPQARQLNPKLKYIFLSIGGNDVGFGQIVGCVIQKECDQTSVPAQTLQQIQQLGPKLDAAYLAIRVLAPRATIFVNLYPTLLPAARDSTTLYCSEINDAELALGNQIQTALNQTIAMHARLFGFTVVDASAQFARHNVCTNRSWFYQPGGAETWHPNALGRAALSAADAVAVQQRTS